MTQDTAELRLREEDAIRKAVKQLSRSERGRNAMAHLSYWIAEYGFGLDMYNQDAVFTLLRGAWGPLASTTIGTMQDAVSDNLLERIEAAHRMAVEAIQEAGS